MLTYLDCLSELSDRRHCAQTGSCFTFSYGQKFREMQLADERGYVRSHNVFATIVVKIKQWPMVTPQHLPHSPCLSQGSHEASTWNSPGHFLEDLKGLGYQAGFRPQAGKASALLSLLSISIQSNETHTKKTNLGFAKVIHRVICESGNRPRNKILTRLQQTSAEFSNYLHVACSERY